MREVNLMLSVLLLLITGAAGADVFGWDPDDVDPGEVTLGTPSLRGTGCSAGTTDVAISTDGTVLSVLFDDFVVEAGGSIGRTIARKGCSMAIPVHVPQGYSVSLITIDYLGFNSLPRRASAKLSVSHFFAGKRGQRFTKNFRSGTEDEYMLSTEFVNGHNVWSACGKDVILRTKTSLMLRNSNRNIEAISTVDSVDLTSGLMYKLSWKRCR
ncbi:MAG: DUF4360 domain-containing protein [Bacteriovoracaceae bacterium]|jgi:hypothetical protein|nr:DUF4360 domain-containing protein [Bacteriovoracaceae bacterium]